MKANLLKPLRPRSAAAGDSHEVESVQRSEQAGHNRASKGVVGSASNAPNDIGRTELHDVVEGTEGACSQLRSPAARLPETLNYVQVGLNIDTSDPENVWDSLVENVKTFASLVEAVGEIHPYAKMAASLILAVVKPFISQSERDQALMKLLEAMQDAYAHVLASWSIVALDDYRKTVLHKLVLQTIECAYFIRDQSKTKSFWQRAAKNAITGRFIDDKIAEFSATFSDLKRVLTEIGVVGVESRVWETHLVTMQVADVCVLASTLEIVNLVHARGAGMRLSKACLPGTRVATLEHLSRWINATGDDNRPRVLFVHGGAGTGKSAIAHSIGQRFDELGRLGSVFCFNRNFQGDRHPESVFSTIARDLANWNPSFRRELALVLQKNRALAETPDMLTQWKHLILEPARRMTMVGPVVGPVVIVIDALDESGRGTSRNLLLSFLTRRVSELPSYIRIIITTRPERDIMLAVHDSSSVELFDLDIRREESGKDLNFYLRHRLSPADPHRGTLKDTCYGLLAMKSEGLFQWASTVCDLLLEPRVGVSLQEQFDELVRSLGHSGLKPIDDLYSTALSLIFPETQTADPIFTTQLSRFRSVMAQVIAAQEPLSIGALHEIRCSGQGLDPENAANEVAFVVPSMGAFLSGVVSFDTPISPLHTSFRDFLLDGQRSGMWHVNPNAESALMALGCIRIMNRELCFNICSLPTSFVRNRDITDLQSRINGAISRALSYSCRYWHHHASHLPTSTSEHTSIGRSLVACREDIAAFLHTKLLFWLEALSFLGQVNQAALSLESVVALFSAPEYLLVSAFIEDVVAFVRRFGRIIAESAPQIYCSALPLSPLQAKIRSVCKQRFRRLPEVIGLALRWQRTQNVLRLGSSPLALMYSPDGRHIVSGLRDRTVRVWNAETGEAVGKPLRGHSATVRSVAYSPDGRFIVSGSKDSTVRVWNAETGKVVGGPLRGHSAEVWSVAYSPDGRRIITGSEDWTVRVWNAGTGKAVGLPLGGHSAAVISVAYSPDGRRIISGSWDSTVRVWSAETGEAIGEPLRGHSAPVTSVAYSPDGLKIVSGSWDSTVRVWSAETGQALVGELQYNVGMQAAGTQDRHFLQGHNLLASADGSAFPRNSPRVKMEDGWVTDENDNLIIWVPDEYRNSLWWPRTRLMIGGRQPSVTIDLKNAKHGSEWAAIYEESGGNEHNSRAAA